MSRGDDGANAACVAKIDHRHHTHTHTHTQIVHDLASAVTAAIAPVVAAATAAVVAVWWLW